MSQLPYAQFVKTLFGMILSAVTEFPWESDHTEFSWPYHMQPQTVHLQDDLAVAQVEKLKNSLQKAASAWIHTMPLGHDALQEFYNL